MFILCASVTIAIKKFVITPRGFNIRYFNAIELYTLLRVKRLSFVIEL